MLLIIFLHIIYNRLNCLKFIYINIFLHACISIADNNENNDNDRNDNIDDNIVESIETMKKQNLLTPLDVEDDNLDEPEVVALL